MEIEQKLFIDKFQPMYFKDFEIDSKIIDILNILIGMNNHYWFFTFTPYFFGNIFLKIIKSQIWFHIIKLKII
jgi:predicted histidine transporter YuiF (NhaC family)